MGWCSGSGVYEPIAHEILTEHWLDDDVKVRLLRTVIKTLRDNDWDCEMDSFDPSDPVVVEAFGLEGLLESYDSADVFDGVSGSRWTYIE